MRFWMHLAVAGVAALAAAGAVERAGITQVFSSGGLLAQIAAVTVLGAALPDVDLPKTRQFRVVAAFVALAVFALARDFFVQRFPSATQLEAAVAGAVAAAAALGVVYAVKPRHRGVTHSFAALAVFALGVFALTQSPLVAGFAALAFATHLACDWEIKLL